MHQTKNTENSNLQKELVGLRYSFHVHYPIKTRKYSIIIWLYAKIDWKSNKYIKRNPH